MRDISKPFGDVVALSRPYRQSIARLADRGGIGSKWRVRLNSSEPVNRRSTRAPSSDVNSITPGYDRSTAAAALADHRQNLRRIRRATPFWASLFVRFVAVSHGEFVGVDWGWMLSRMIRMSFSIRIETMLNRLCSVSISIVWDSPLSSSTVKRYVALSGYTS